MTRGRGSCKVTGERGESSAGRGRTSTTRPRESKAGRSPVTDRTTSNKPRDDSAGCTLETRNACRDGRKVSSCNAESSSEVQETRGGAGGRRSKGSVHSKSPNEEQVTRSSKSNVSIDKAESHDASAGSRRSSKSNVSIDKAESHDASAGSRRSSKSNVSIDKAESHDVSAGSRRSSKSNVSIDKAESHDASAGSRRSSKSNVSIDKAESHDISAGSRRSSKSNVSIDKAESHDVSAGSRRSSKSNVSIDKAESHDISAGSRRSSKSNVSIDKAESHDASAGRGKKSTDTSVDSEVADPVVKPKARCIKSKAPTEDVGTLEQGVPNGLKDGADRRSSSTASQVTEGRSVTSKALDKAVDALRLRRKDVSNAAEEVNDIIEKLLKCEAFQDDQFFSEIKKMNAGSYYEKVKISKPNEFDVMLKIKVERLNALEYHSSGVFFVLEPKRLTKKDPLRKYTVDGKLSAKKMISSLRQLIEKEIARSGNAGIVVASQEKDSPAITLKITKNAPNIICVDLVLALEVQQNWPRKANEGMKIDEWLGTKVKRGFKLTPNYYVPKQTNEATEENEETWRISFSHIEKNILTNHGSLKTCCEKGGESCCRQLTDHLYNANHIQS
ncbi:cyclic GMP-AMP synthase isoform X2 [Bombina bombina]|uniref:cyclic GMP-AMP synthase isoform X2 n=1 Tax=Bombina bombina TaxID=8345 RepID=UPI00235AE52E|nr:cyclic GMP-AMP synthase isoform X2 [Bombina bombina]